MSSAVVMVTTDLFLQSRILELSTKIGVHVGFVSREEELMEYVRTSSPGLVILDLAATDYDPFSCARRLKRTGLRLKILGFYPHVITILKTRAEEGKIDYVVPNSRLLGKLRMLLESMVERR